jgi:hypothetical protein
MYHARLDAAPLNMRSHRMLSAAAVLAAVAMAGCGGGEVAKPLAEDAARSAERAAARDAAAATREALAGTAADAARSSAATSLRERSRDALSALETLAADDQGARAAICRRIDLLEVRDAEPDEQAYAAYEKIATELMPFSEFVGVIHAVDALSHGDLDELATTAGCL